MDRTVRSAVAELRTRLAGHSGSGVGAVVRHHIDIQQVCGVVLLF